ncbi:MAG TPA: patatin-like phospholipase family protein [Pyrinomonadaceae bacterium]|jgi:predicted acylesterase/phospholipase RssA|nr:patatin-like phospholipase family protein [Pyrinomonadaceae bacterium]
MSNIFELYRWIWKRLPRKFSITLLVLSLLHILALFPVMVIGVSLGFGWILNTWLPRHNFKSPVLDFMLVVFTPPFFSVAILLCALLGFLICYWVSVYFYRITRKHNLGHLKIHPPVLPAFVTEVERRDDNPLKRFESIGIILAGGGAKGAYQAGAMKAIYQFLDKHEAHHKVRMIAGTSIGSWNSMFWLADLIKGPAEDQPGLLEQWWNSVDAQSVIQPAYYLPTRRNFFLSNEPWQESFNEFFIKNEDARERLLHHLRHPDCLDSLHFYFTRANVARAILEFTTNAHGLTDLRANLPGGRRTRPAAQRERYKVARRIEDIREAVFSSMDLPPLFQYTPIGDAYYEDGGVIDNLPIRFGTEFEGCDLLFVLPLNANFDEDVNMQSVTRRMFRVLNVRQGVLERHSFKLIYLYNELASLRDSAKKDRKRAQKYEDALRRLQDHLDGLDPQPDARIASLKEMIGGVLPANSHMMKNEREPRERPSQHAGLRAQRREHKMVQIFTICPAPKLLINTAEFWKTTEAGHAFRLMYDATMGELESFDFENADPSWIQMAQVSPQGSISYFSDF